MSTPMPEKLDFGSTQTARTLRYLDSEEPAPLLRVERHGTRNMDAFRRVLMASAIGTAFMTAGVLTFPAMDLRGPGSLARYWTQSGSRRKRITPLQAHEIATRAMERIDILLEQERTQDYLSVLRLYEG